MLIKSERLYLEPLGIKHVEGMCIYALDLENTRYMVRMPKDDVQEVKEFLMETDAEWKKEKPSFYECAVILGDRMIGAVSDYFDEEFECGEIGWVIDKAYWGHGYAVEGAKALITLCEKKLHIKRYTAHCDSENHPSIRVMEKLGMKLADQYEGRKNRASEEIRTECQFEMVLMEC